MNHVERFSHTAILSFSCVMTNFPGKLSKKAHPSVKRHSQRETKNYPDSFFLKRVRNGSNPVKKCFELHNEPDRTVHSYSDSFALFSYEISKNYRYVANSGYLRYKLRFDGNDFFPSTSEKGQILPKTVFHLKMSHITVNLFFPGGFKCIFLKFTNKTLILVQKEAISEKKVKITQKRVLFLKLE